MTLDVAVRAARADATRRAFDSVAPVYDGPLGNNALVARMRQRMWRTLAALFPRPARLLDLGCGTGIDAVYLAARGHRVWAVDPSPRMVELTQARAAAAGVSQSVTVAILAADQIDRLGVARVDGVYSNLGALNCAGDLAAVGRACASRLEPGGVLVASVIGRLCPWEVAYYGMRGRWGRASVRWRAGPVPVGLNGHTVWTRYLTPGELCRALGPSFVPRHHCALGLFLPPPYLLRVVEAAPRLAAALGWLDDHAGCAPGLREMGDHFLVVLERRRDAAG